MLLILVRKGEFGTSPIYPLECCRLLMLCVSQNSCWVDIYYRKRYKKSTFLHL